MDQLLLTWLNWECLNINKLWWRKIFWLGVCMLVSRIKPAWEYNWVITRGWTHSCLVRKQLPCQTWWWGWEECGAVSSDIYRVGNRQICSSRPQRETDLKLIFAKNLSDLWKLASVIQHAPFVKFLPVHKKVGGCSQNPIITSVNVLKVSVFMWGHFLWGFSSIETFGVE